MSLLEKLKAGKRNFKVIKFPGAQGDVGLQVLSNQESQDAVFGAEALFKRAEIEISASCLDAYEDERSTQILFRALRDPEDAAKPFAATVAELRAGITKEEKEALIEAYTAFSRECSPDFQTMDDKEFEDLWEAIKKNPAILSSVSSSTMLKRLILYLASRPQTSPAASGSTS